MAIALELFDPAQGKGLRMSFTMRPGLLHMGTGGGAPPLIASVGSRRRGVEAMPARGTEAERVEELR